MTNTFEDVPEHPRAPTVAELDAIKARQQATWASGDFGIIGTTLQIVGESLCEAVDSRRLEGARRRGRQRQRVAGGGAPVRATSPPPTTCPRCSSDGRRRAEARAALDPVPGSRRRGAAVRRRLVRRRAVVVRRDVRARTRRARPASCCASAVAADDRPGELDAARLHRRAVRRHRPARAATAGR